ncbi:Imitation switch isoform alias nucleosome remodeling factor [Globisporangium polare]
MKHIEDDDKSSVSGSSSSSGGSSPSAADSSHDDTASDAGSKKAEDDGGDVSMDEDDDAAVGEEEEDDAADEDSAKDGSKLDVEDAKLLSKEERDALLKEEAAVLQQQRDLQSKSLEAVKQSLAQDTDWSKKTAREKKMAFLMAQSDVFTSFLMGGSSTMGKEMTKNKAAAKEKSNSRRNKSSELEDAEAVAEMDESRFTRVTQQPKCIKFGTMKPYQLEGLNWMIRLHDSGVNGILADEMGLGKTLQSISLLAYLREARGIEGPHIIIVPKSTTGNWMRELKRWCPSIRAFKFMGSKEERAVQRETVVKLDFDALVLSYEVAIIEKAVLQKIKWKYLLIDEAHRVKNEHSKLSKVVREFNVEHRLLITGTPLQNNLHELWALLNFLLPDIFTDSEDFDSWFNVDEEKGQENVIKKLHTVLRPFLLRRLKADVEHSLPPKIETKLYVGLSEMQREWYMRVLHRDATHLNAIGGSDRVRLLNILMQLRKVCNHPYLFEGAEPGPPYIEGSHLWENCGKLTLLHRLLPRLKAQQSRVLIFCQMTSMMDILEDYMRYNSHDYCRLDGSTKGEDRDYMMEEFNEPTSTKFCFLLSTRAGGLGINLATADIVILFDSDWNPQVDLQAMDRAHRIGQKKLVRVFRFITDGTVEEKIVERAERKLYLDAAIIQQGRLAQQNRKLSKDELMTMVRFGADEIFNARGSMITDDDIDAILAKGEERTESMKAKIAADMQHNLANFSLSGDSANGVSSLYEFEGEVFAKDSSTGQVLPSTFIALPQRERKANYNEDEYYRKQAGIVKAKKVKKDDVPKTPVVHDYQFFNQEVMVALLTKKNQIEIRRKELMRLIKEAKSEEQRLKPKPKKKSAADGGAAEDGGASASNSGGEEEVDENLKSVQLEKELEETEMDPKDAKQLERLEREGFGEWTRRDLKQFITSCERYGRADRANVCAEVAQVLAKDVEQVERYFGTFWKRYAELKDHAKYIEKIERGEKRLERNEVVKQALARKCSRYSNPLRDMKLHYPSGYKSKGYILEEDVFLVVMMNKYGPLEHWSEIRDEIRKAWQFRFDWFFKSRTIAELQKRGEMLTRMVEKENEELKTKSAKDEEELVKKAKKPSSSSSSSSKSKSKSKSSSSKSSGVAAGSSSKSKKRSSSSSAPSSSSKKHRSK